MNLEVGFFFIIIINIYIYYYNTIFKGCEIDFDN